MPFFGKIIVIKRNGTDGTHFPLTANSCLFGRKKECDIRIQLPQVSKEHCKIEVNENKEATLINLSTANPTQLNGSYFQHPTCLKHKDVLTIIDRSFRFEYPPLLVHRKRHSISQEKETLQVLHIQQVDQEELLHQNSECNSPQSPDKKLEQEGQNIHGSDNKKTKEYTTRQYDTPESIHKTSKSNRKNETSPFTQLYYLMKNEEESFTAKEGLRNEIPAQQTEYPLGKDKNDCLAEITIQTPHRRSAYMKTEAVVQEVVEQSEEIENQDLRSGVCSLVSVDKTNTRNTLVSLQTCSTEKKQESEEATDQVHFPDIKENDLEKAEAFKSDANLRAKKESAEGVAKTCCIVSLEYSDGTKSVEQSTEGKDIKTKSTLTNTFESDENSLTTSKLKEKSIQIYPSPNSREVSRSSSKSRMLPAEVNSLDIFSSTESSAETEGSSMYVNREEHASVTFNSSIHFETKENNFAEQPLNSEILKETNYICSNDTNKDGNSRITAYSPCLRRSPRRSLKQYKDLANRSYFKEMSTEKVSLETPTSVPPGSDRMRTPHQLSEQTVGVKRPPQKRKDREFDSLTQPSGKRKRVSFGGHLSPELFDKRLPPNSPLKRGAIPARLSLPFGNSPRAVLKKLGQSVSKASSPARRSPTATSPARRSPTAMSPARRSPTAMSPARRSPTAMSPARRSPMATSPARRSPTATSPARRSPTASPASDFSCDLPQRKGRFSVSLVASFSSTVDQGTTNEEKHVPENFTEAKTLESSEHEFNTSKSKRRSKKFALKRSSLRRSGAMDAIHSKRRSGASGANLIVAKSWAEVVKQGVPKSQLSIARKCGCKRPSKKITSKQPKSDVAKTPARKVKGYFTTGHANSPAPIVIGKAHTRLVKMAGQAPKVMLNYPVKQDCNLNESFTGLTDMFNTPPNWKKKISMCSVDKTNMPTPEGSALHTSENSGEMTVPSFTLTSQQRFSLDASPLPQISSLVENRLQVSPRGENTEEGIEEIVKGSSSLETAVNETLVGMQQKSKKEKSKQKLESEVFSGIKTLMRTPRQKPEPVEALSGVKRLMRTPKTKPEPVDALSGVKRLMRTPKTKSEPVDALSGVKRLMRTPKTKSEPVDALSGVKRLMRTPKAKSKTSGVLSDIKRVMRTPKEKSEPVEVISGVIREKFNVEPFEDEPACSIVVETPYVLEELQDSVTKITPRQTAQSAEKIDVGYIIEPPKEKIQSVENTEGIVRLLTSPKQRFEALEEIVGISRLSETPRQMFKPMDDNLGLQNLIAKPKQSFFSPEVDYNSIKEMLDTSDEHKVKLQEPSNLKEEHEPDILSRSKLEFQPVGMDLQSETIIDFEKTATLGNPAVIDSELPQPLASTRQTRRRKGDKSTSTEGSDTKKTQRCARNILSAKSTKSMQTNESSDQNITEPRPAEESEKTKRTRRGKSRPCSAERNTDKDSDSVMQTQEPSKETSGKVQQSVKRRGAAKAHLNSKQTASPEESSRQLITKTLRSRNKKDDKNDLKSEFTQINPLDKMQCKDLEHSEMELINQTTTKGKGRQGKGRKVRFLLEKRNSVPFEENYMIGDESAAHEEKDNTSFESSATSVKGMVLRRSKRKAPAASLSVSTSSLSKRVLTKRCEDEQKEGINLPLEHTTVLKDDSSGSSGFAKENLSQEVQNKENPNEILENVQIPVDDRPSKQRKVAKKRDQGKQTLSHELSTEYDHQAVATEAQNVSKGQKVSQGYPLGRGRRKCAVSDEAETKYYDKESTDTKDQNMVVKTAFSTIENPSKRGREKKVAPVSSQTPLTPFKNDSLPVHLPSTSSKSTEVDQNKVLETAQFATANAILSRRGRRRKIEDIPESSVSTRKRSRLLDNDNQEKVSEALQGVTKDNVCKRGGRHVVPYESSASNGQPGNDSKEDIPVNEKVPLENSFGKENQPKRGRRKNNFLASQVPSSLKVSITLPSVPSDKGETANEDQSMLIRNGIGEEKIENGSERNDKLVLRSTRQVKLEKIFQETQNVDLEKTAVSNEKQSRRGRRKVDAIEATVSQKEKCDLTVKGGTISKDQHIILANTISDLKGASKGTQQKVRKRKNLPKNIDPSNSDQNSNLGLQVLSEKGNREKEKAPFKRGKQKRINSESESSVATSDKKKTVFTENNSSNPTSGNIESTTLQRGKKKRKEHQTTVVIQPTVEMESKTRASRRIKK